VATEVDGSIVQPATRAALFSIKATVGKINRTGVQGGAPSFDSVGVLSKTAKDTADLLGVLTGEDYSEFLTGSWEGVRVGFVNPDLWQPASFVVEPNEDFKKQTYAEMDAAVAKIRSLGAKVIEDVPMISLADVTKDPRGVKEIEQLFSK